MKRSWVITLCVLVEFCSAQTRRIATKPVVASPKLFQYNPTQSTVSLEKPFCVFDTLSPTSTMKVDVYVVVSSVASSSFTPGKTYRETKVGETEPYQAVSFSIPNCSSPPKFTDLLILSKVDKTLNDYLVRIGSHPTCAGDPGPTVLCNGPLAMGTAYRFKFLLVDGTTTKAETAWSEPIVTRNAQHQEDLDDWIGKRSGAMVVITSVLSSFTFILICLLIAVGVYDLVYRATGSQDGMLGTDTPATPSPREGAGAPLEECIVAETN
ncbi:uroplakin-3a-like [Acipenser oxyrinchus oxyrinchus]|uniref:Uroplakin-3a-like n=1 Tax=Acipenser oxyrinchus oxyrinchus TaxID=40147 RepID=A0AAD8DDH0_ACIOX|nr:uroplakin-3a-like [Acipenser oxyrinchus oxyrinchus]